MPELTSEGEAGGERVRDGDGLAGLESVEWAGSLLVEESVGIVVEAVNVGAGGEEEGVAGGANVDIGRGTVVNVARVAHGNSGTRVFTPKENDLSAEEDIAGAVGGGGGSGGAVVDEWFGGSDDLDAGIYGEADDFVEAVPSGKFG